MFYPKYYYSTKNYINYRNHYNNIRSTKYYNNNKNNKNTDNNNDKDNNIIDKLSIIETNEKSSSYTQNVDYGYNFEQSISVKSSLFLPVISINDNNIYTRQYRHFYALKVVIINNNTFQETTNLLNEGKFKIIPFSNNYYKLQLNGYQDYFISYNPEGIIVMSDKWFAIKLYKNYRYQNYHINSENSYTDKYEGTFKLYNLDNKPSNLKISLYSTSCEIDGLFEVQEDIHLNNFKVKEIYTNNNDNKIIKKDSLMVYEIKSGKQDVALIDQMYKRGHFINQYLKFVYNKPIYYVGFYKSKDNTEQEINIEKNIEIEGALKNGKNSGEDETNYISGEKINDNEQIIGIEKLKSKISPPANIELYDKLKNLPFGITIFELKDTIFGEYLKYEREDLNLLRNLNNRIEKFDKMEKKMDILEKNIEKIMRHLNIPIEEDEKSEKSKKNGKGNKGSEHEESESYDNENGDKKKKEKKKQKNEENKNDKKNN